MLLSLWRRLWNGQPYPSRGKFLRQNRHRSYRPGFDLLEDRLVPALSARGIPQLAAAGLTPHAGAALTLREPDPAIPAAGSGLQQITRGVPTGTKPIVVTVAENAPDSVIDLGAVFDAMDGIQHNDGLRLRMVGNTNSGLVKTDLSEAELTLTYARGKCGTATITVAATDADGVSVKTTVLVTVKPSNAAATKGYHPPAPEKIEGGR
jgi:hypothetical protein